VGKQFHVPITTGYFEQRKRFRIALFVPLFKYYFVQGISVRIPLCISH